MKNRISILTFGFSTLILLIVSSLAVADDYEALKQRVEDLEQELAEAREKLAEAESQKEDDAQPAASAKPKESPVKIGGALRAHYVYGDYTNRRGQSPGDADLELFRVNADLNHNNLIGRVEYRWYDGYSMMHSAWLGYDAGGSGTFKAGIVRVPFGPGDYGASTSWFFDQHFYVGLADDMDLGFTWTKPFDKLTVDLAYFIQDEGPWDGASLDGSRYSFDVVKRRGEGGVAEGFEEQHQLNLRVIHALEGFGDLGASLQYGRLKGTNVDDDGADHYAVSAHAKNSFGDFTLISQISRYGYNIMGDSPWKTRDLILMGAYDYTTLVASKAWIPSLSLRFNGIDTSKLTWLDSVTPYLEWSSIRKTRNDFNPSSMAIIGAAWSWGGLYAYTDMAFADGNDFVGCGEFGCGDYGRNINNRWQKRFNFNVGYYFDFYK